MSFIDRTARIEVACLVDFDDLDANDRAADGSCAVDGSYRLRITEIPASTRAPEFVEKVLDHFHSRVPIACLEDFTILVSVAGDGAMDAEDLGTVSWDEPPRVPGSEASDGFLPTPSPHGTTDPFDPFSDEGASS